MFCAAGIIWNMREVLRPGEILTAESESSVHWLSVTCIHFRHSFAVIKVLQKPFFPHKIQYITY